MVKFLVFEGDTDSDFYNAEEYVEKEEDNDWLILIKSKNVRAESLPALLIIYIRAYDDAHSVFLIEGAVVRVLDVYLSEYSL